MNLTGKQKAGISIGTVVLVAVAIPLIAYAVKKRRVKKGFRDDVGFDPDTQIMYAYVGEQGFTNVRSEPKIKGSFEEAYQTTSWWDWLYDPVAVASENIENKIGTITSGRIGKVISMTTGQDGHIWYKVKLDTPLSGRATGWVRKDVVRIEIVEN
jgi:hypothetical protein